MTEAFQKHILNHLHRNMQEAAQNLPEQDWECRLQKLVEKMGGTITFESKRHRDYICDPGSIPD